MWTPDKHAVPTKTWFGIKPQSPSVQGIFWGRLTSKNFEIISSEIFPDFGMNIWQSNHFSFVFRHLFVFSIFVPSLLLCSVVCLWALRVAQVILKAFLLISHWVCLSKVPSQVNKDYSEVFEELCDTDIYWHSIDDQKGIMLSSETSPKNWTVFAGE